MTTPLPVATGGADAVAASAGQISGVSGGIGGGAGLGGTTAGDKPAATGGTGSRPASAARMQSQAVAPKSAAGSTGAGTVVEIGGPAIGAAGRPGLGDGILVTAGSQEFLIWQGQRLSIDRDWAADVLGFGGVEPIPVTAQWLDLLPPGPAIAPPTVTGAGRAGPPIAGRATVIGQLFRSDAGGGSVTHYLTLASGLAPLTATEYALVSAEPGVPAERVISAADLAQAERVDLPRAGGKLPSEPPAVRTLPADESVCLEYPDARGQKTADVVRHRVPDSERLATTTSTGAMTVSVAVTPGGGALVGTNPAVAAKDQDQVLIDDNGTVYPLTGDARDALGFSAERAVIVPSRWLSLLPRGPLLSTAGEG